ncbi:hypothetical protein SSX86_004801 [Deinandra increscens subsp. villosa]|uniref:Peroxisomal membrane protein PEX16 n=1 Tax=Deinandra increscens subsp. villosa TaxID=3103831 RepID=A0AAP0H9F2_9ASTR
MEAYKRWVRRNKEYVHSLESLANGMTWLLPERFSESEIVPEAVTSILGIVTAVNDHIIETTPSQGHPKPQEPSSFPYSLFLTLMKDVETLVEVMAQHFYGDDGKWNFMAVTEATKVLARLALLRNSGYKMLLQGGESINDGKDPNDTNQPQARGRLLQQGRNGNFTPEGRALSAMSRFGENARMINNSTGFHMVVPHNINNPAIIQLPESDIKRPTLLSFLSDKGLPGGLMLMGEIMFIARPLLYVLLIRKYGPRSWLPWFISLTIDLMGMSSSTMLLTRHFDRKLHLSDSEKDELRRRKLLLALYLMRDPCFGKYTRQRLESTEKMLEPVPVVGFLAAKLIELLVGAQTRYTYMSGS